MKATVFALIGAALFIPAFPASAAKDETQWQQHWKFVEAMRKQQIRGTAVAGKPGQRIDGVTPIAGLRYAARATPQ